MKRYSTQMSMYTECGQEIEVSDAEDGGIQIDVSEPTVSPFRLYIQLNEVDSIIEMLKTLKESQLASTNAK